MNIGFTLPFSRSTGSLGYFEMTRDELSAVGENIKSLLLTNWGERVNHYNLGCNLIEFLFENNDVDELRERISDRIESQIAMWLPFVVIEKIKVTFPEEDSNLKDHAVLISVSFRLTSRPNLINTITVPIQP